MVKKEGEMNIKTLEENQSDNNNKDKKSFWQLSVK